MEFRPGDFGRTGDWRRVRAVPAFPQGGFDDRRDRGREAVSGSEGHGGGYRIVALTVSSALFMQFLDSTALNVAIPAMARDLHVPAIDLNVAILAYQLSMTVLIPVGAAICDRMGQRNA